MSWLQPTIHDKSVPYFQKHSYTHARTHERTEGPGTEKMCSPYSSIYIIFFTFIIISINAITTTTSAATRTNHIFFKTFAFYQLIMQNLII